MERDVRLLEQLKIVLLGLAAGFVMSAPALAQDGATAAAKAEWEAAVKAAETTRVAGPAEVTLIDQAKLKIAAGQFYIPSAQASRLLKAMGNRVDSRLIGMVLPAGEADDWMVVVEYEKSGYIKDDDARDWKADELLDNLKQGTEASNKERRERGISEMEVIGWAEKPTYDASAHRLVWSVLSRDKGAAADRSQGVNYNTYALGREGYISMNLVTEAKMVDKYKPVARNLLGGLDFNGGKAYADFNSTTDKVAEYGLAALVGGIAAKKLGLFAIIAAFFLKFIKVFIFAAVAAVPALGKLFKWARKDKAVEEEEAVPVARPAAPAAPAAAPKPRVWNEADREKAWEEARKQTQGASAPPAPPVAPASSSPEAFPAAASPTISSTDETKRP